MEFVADASFADPGASVGFAFGAFVPVSFALHVYSMPLLAADFRAGLVLP